MMVSRHCFAMAAMDGKVYAAGGRDDDDMKLSSVECFEHDTGEWSQIAAMSIKRCYFAMAAVDGKVYAAGGYAQDDDDDEETPLSSVEVFDPKSGGGWIIAAPMLTGRYMFAMAAVGRKVYAAGGHDGSVELSSVECLDPETGEWSQAPNSSTARSDLAMAAAGGKLYAAGGFSGNGSTNTVEMFDASAGGGWVTVAPMRTTRSCFAMTAVDGKLYASGGRSDNNFSRVSSVECYDPATDTWQEVTPLPAARVDHCMVAI
jgi:N-acetylneuraminic acid mutarotase